MALAASRLAAIARKAGSVRGWVEQEQQRVRGLAGEVRRRKAQLKAAMDSLDAADRRLQVGE